MADKRVFLKVKLKSLAEEARIIKREESKRKVPRKARTVGCMHPTANGVGGERWRKSSGEDGKADRAARSVRSAARRARDWYPMSAQQLHELHRHRIDVVRMESRLTGIAYALIRGGRPIAKMDSLRGIEPRHVERIQAMLKKYGDLGDSAQKWMIESKPLEVIQWWTGESRKAA